MPRTTPSSSAGLAGAEKAGPSKGKQREAQGGRKRPHGEASAADDEDDFEYASSAPRAIRTRARAVRQLSPGGASAFA